MFRKTDRCIGLREHKGKERSGYDHVMKNTDTEMQGGVRQRGIESRKKLKPGRQQTRESMRSVAQL